VYVKLRSFLWGLVRVVAIAVAGLCVAALLGGGVPLAWLWIASRLQPSGGQGIDQLAALVLIAGTIATYVAIGAVAGRFGRPPQRRTAASWNRSLSEDRNAKRPTTAVEQVFIVATIVVGAAFEVWLLLFAHQTPWGS
jgi:multisubunit Na+/H+ antiporter MnhC subunit